MNSSDKTLRDGASAPVSKGEWNRWAFTLRRALQRPSRRVLGPPLSALRPTPPPRPCCLPFPSTATDSAPCSSSIWICFASTARGWIPWFAAIAAATPAACPVIQHCGTAQEGVRACIAGDMPPGAQYPVETGRNQHHRGPEMSGIVGDIEVDTPIPVWPRNLAVGHCSRVTLARPATRPAVPDADLRRAEHQERALARRVPAVEIHMTERQLARADLDIGQVPDIDVVSREPRPHEQRDIVAPRYPGLVE